jgi:hypothetical protein
VAELLHPKAVHNLPMFITAPGGTDVLMVATAAFLMIAVVAFGVLYFRLHSLPEHIAHKSHKVQMEIVSVLCLIALFTHMHIFWIAGLVLAFVDIPDFGTPLKRIAGSVERIAGAGPFDPTAEIPPQAIHGAEGEPPAEAREARQGAITGALPTKAAVTAAAKKERSHA